MSKSGNSIYDIAHLFFGKDFQYNALCWFLEKCKGVTGKQTVS